VNHETFLPGVKSFQSDYDSLQKYLFKLDFPTIIALKLQHDKISLLPAVILFCSDKD